MDVLKRPYRPSDEKHKNSFAKMKHIFHSFKGPLMLSSGTKSIVQTVAQLTLYLLIAAALQLSQFQTGQKNFYQIWIFPDVEPETITSAAGSFKETSNGIVKCVILKWLAVLLKRFPLTEPSTA